LLPIPPLDGSRVLFAFAPEPLQKIMLQIEGAGFGVILVILVLLLPVLGPILSTVNTFLITLLAG
jgi:Zn-dependent protease